MSSAPPSLLQLREYLAERTGLSAALLGIVGDSAHRSGYHLGRDRIYSSTGQGDRDYSVQTLRDRAGLSNYASAIDIGSFPHLRAFSTWLVDRCKDNDPDSHDIREIIYSPDGKTVYRWDAVTRKVYLGGDGTGQGDDSHLFHTHVSFYRDSRDRDQRPIFRRYWEGNTMRKMYGFEKRAYVYVPAGLRFHEEYDAERQRFVPHDGDPINPRGRELVYYTTVDAKCSAVGWEPDGVSDPNSSSPVYYVERTKLGKIRLVNDLTPEARINAFNDGVTAASQAALTARKA